MNTGVAIVTGASKGIGLATVRLLLQRGFEVVAVARPSDTFRHALNGLRADGLEPIAVEVDVTDAAQVNDAVSAAAKRGPLKLVVNSAGAIVIESVEETDPGKWDEIFATNVRGPFLVARSAIPHLRSASGGAIVNVASVAGTLGAGLSAAYGASKAALINFSFALAAELVRDDIRVCVISPGMIDTGMGREVLDTYGSIFGVETAGYLSALQGRWGTPEEVAEAIAWLGSNQATAVSGAHVVADLGQTARLF
jgi:NAD(P)-dependent dehydrogenase (short-subunit alcohol dehydrogenase family)